jgi:hypothetical protein
MLIEGEKSMPYNKSKSTKRFSFGINRNPTAKKAGSNTLTISTNPGSDKYSVGTSSLTMTVKEASALQGFLNSELGGYSPADDSTII